MAKICIFRDFWRFFAIFLEKSAIWWRISELKRHLVAKTCIFRDFQLFIYFLSFVNKQLISQFSAVCLHFSCLFTFSVFSCFLSFQLFVYFSAVYLLSQFCKQTTDFSVFSCLFTFQLFVYILSFVNKQLFVYNSAVCLHFSAKSRFCLFCSKLTPVQHQYPFSVFDSCLFTF